MSRDNPLVITSGGRGARRGAGGGGGEGRSLGTGASYLDVIGEHLDMVRQVVVLLHILLGGGKRAVGPGPCPEALQACLALSQLLQCFRVTTLRMELCKAALQHVLNLHTGTGSK